MTDLSRTAEARLAAAPVPSRRYGLSVFLRKAYPAVGNWKLETGNWRPTVRGAEVRAVAWEDVPADVVELVRRRAEADPFAAAHVLENASIPFVEIVRDRTLVIEFLPFSTLLISVAAGVTVSVRESLESAFRAESRFKDPVEQEKPLSTLCVLRLGPGATVRWFGASVGAPGFTIAERLAIVQENATLDYHSALIGGSAVREELLAVLQGPGATARAHTLFVGASDDQFDLGVTAEHRAPRTVSDLRAKGVLSGKAQGVYRGLVRVEKDASGSDGYQRCDALLLSPTAEVDPVPNLEINTNDVRCTHGVTVSRPNPDQLFYLQSRGLSEAAARDVLVEGFAGTILRSYPEQQREDLRAAMQNVLRGST